MWCLKGHQGPEWLVPDFLEQGGRHKGLEGCGKAEEMVEGEHFRGAEQRIQHGHRPGAL